MAENWNDYGDYGEEERYQNKSKLGKVFSFKTLKKIVKWFFLLLLFSLYAILLFRLFTNAPSAKMTALLRTKADVDYYTENGKLTVFSQELDEFITKDGGFAVYDVRLIAETNEIQFTVRYNNSTTKSLRESSYRKTYAALLNEDSTEEDKQAAEEAALAARDSVPDAPFEFVLIDENGNKYTSYEQKTFSRLMYKYVRVAFTIPELFKADMLSPDVLYPSPDATSPLYIYKGAFEAEDDGSVINTLALGLTYNDETFGNTLNVYRAEKQIERYDFKNQMNSGYSE